MNGRQRECERPASEADVSHWIEWAPEGVAGQGRILDGGGVPVSSFRANERAAPEDSVERAQGTSRHSAGDQQNKDSATKECLEGLVDW